MPAVQTYFARKPLGVKSVAKLRACLVQGVLAVVLALPCAAVADEYRLAPGDVLRVMIVGIPELNVDVPIEMDGAAWFPLVGSILAGGTTLADVRTRTAEAYATMSLSRPVARSDNLPQIIDNSQVYVAVASYRPIYIAGDVGTVREIPFRAGMTLQHVLALASAVPSWDGVEIATPGEIAAAATALAHEYAQIWRQKAFLGTDTPQDFDRIFVAKGDAFDEIVVVERSILAETRAGIEAQKQHFHDEIARIDALVAALGRQKDTENDGFAMDEKALADVQDLFSRNLVPASRLTDVRRASLVTASRVFQIDVALENARGQAASLKAELLAVDNDARVKAWKDLGDAVARVQPLRSDLEALMAKGAGGGQTDLFPTETKTIVTRDGAPLSSAETSLSLVLMPADIVEIRRVPLQLEGTSKTLEANG